MRKSQACSLDMWPLRVNGDPIFTCTEDAIYFAHLINDRIEWIDKLTKLRKKAYFEIGIQRSRLHPGYQRMMDLSVRAQFYRECLEEVKRINEGNENV